MIPNEDILKLIVDSINSTLKTKAEYLQEKNTYFNMILEIAKHIENKPIDPNLDWLYKIFEEYRDCNRVCVPNKFEIRWYSKKKI